MYVNMYIYMYIYIYTYICMLWSHQHVAPDPPNFLQIALDTPRSPLLSD